MVPALALFIIILLEGYVVLSTELLVIRQLLPFVGSGTDTISIIIAAVLMPLAFGYFIGGQYRPVFNNRGVYMTIRRKLAANILISSAFLLAGLSFATYTIFFETLISSGVTNRLILTSAYVLAFTVIPVFLLGQTVPLASNYFRRHKMAESTGKVLFFSTVGSFLGAVFSTLVLMSFFGVNIAVMTNFFFLFYIMFVLERANLRRNRLLANRNFINMGIFLILAIAMNSQPVLTTSNIVAFNEYNMVRIISDEDGSKHFTLNNNLSSKVGADGMPHGYIAYVDQQFIAPTQHEAIKPKDILVIGAGGFTLGLSDEKNYYTFVDIDDDLKDLAEEHFLPKKLGKNKQFEPTPARAFLTQTKKKYDLILLDAYVGDVSIPEHLVTKEFFAQVKTRLRNDGVIIANFILSPGFDSAFARNIDATLRSIYPFVSRLAVTRYDGWNKSPEMLNNILYIYWHDEDYKRPSIYTDNKNTMFVDKPHNKMLIYELPSDELATP